MQEHFEYSLHVKRSDTFQASKKVTINPISIDIDIYVYGIGFCKEGRAAQIALIRLVQNESMLGTWDRNLILQQATC